MSELPSPPAGGSSSRRVLRGFAAMSLSSLGVMAVQLGYAAITSRLLPPAAFGAYAVALAGVGLMGMMGGASLGQAAARREHDSVPLDRSLVTLSLIVGCFAGVVAMLLAPLWGRLWGVPESTLVIQVLALGIPLSALSAVLAGILRRRGRTSAVAGRTGVGHLVGLAIGLVAVLSLRTTWSLGVAAVAGSFVATILVGAALPRELLRLARPNSDSVDDVMYGLKSAGLSLLRYGTNMVPAWSIGRFVGAVDLGAYNRATTLLTVPMEAVQRSFSYSLFPELRPGGPSSLNRNALTQIMILVTWPALFVGGIGYFAAAPLIGIALGPGWESARSIAGLALLLGVVPMIGVPLGSALEARGRFRATALGWIMSAGLVGAGASAAAATETAKPAVFGLLGASLSATATYGMILARVGQLSIPDLLKGTRTMLAIQAGISLLLIASLPMLPPGDVIALMWVSAIGAIELVALWGLRHRTTFGVVATRHQLPGFRGVENRDGTT